MILDRNISKYLIVEDESIRVGLNKVEVNEDGIIICVDNGGVLKGLLTDGDFRRWVLSSEHIDLDQPIHSIINRDIVSAPIESGEERISSLMSEGIDFIPLLDGNKRCVALAKHRKEHFFIDQHKIGPGYPVFIVAEIGNNHNGSLDMAMRLVDAAVDAGASCAKFQLRDLDTLYKIRGMQMMLVKILTHNIR